MPEVIKTVVDPFLVQAAKLQTLIVEMMRSVPDAEAVSRQLVFAVNAVERATLEVPRTAQMSALLDTREKQSTRMLHELTLGIVSYVQLYRPDLQQHVPTLSRFDTTTPYVLANELSERLSRIPELSDVAALPKEAVERQLELLDSARHAKARREKAKHDLKIARALLERAIKDARHFILSHAEPDSDFVRKLKRPYKQRAKKPTASAAPVTRET